MNAGPGKYGARAPVQNRSLGGVARGGTLHKGSS